VSDQVDKNLKYGGGPESVRGLMEELSNVFHEFEGLLNDHTLAMERWHQATTEHEVARGQALAEEIVEKMKQTQTSLDRILDAMSPAIMLAMSEPGRLEQ